MTNKLTEIFKDYFLGSKIKEVSENNREFFEKMCREDSGEISPNNNLVSTCYSYIPNALALLATGFMFKYPEISLYLFPFGEAVRLTARFEAKELNKEIREYKKTFSETVRRLQKERGLVQ